MASPAASSKPAEAKKKNKGSVVSKAQVNGGHADAGLGETAPDVSVNGGESSYVREIEKRVRNVNKKIAAMQKVESIVAENPGHTLDQLVAKNIINKDQREQVLKKPSLVGQLSSLQEQREQFTKFEEELRAKYDSERQELEAKHQEDLEAARADSAKERDGYLVISKFLCGAAARRGELVEGEEEDDDTQAFEGLLLALYAGNDDSVDAMQKLVSGSGENVASVNGDLTSATYARVKELSMPYGNEAEAEAAVNGAGEPGTEAGVAAPAGAVSTDLTVANAGLTELQGQPSDAVATPATAGDATSLGGERAIAAVEAPDATGVDDGAANAAATQPPTDTMGDSWVAVPRDPAEVETAAPAATQTQAWADEPMVESAPVSNSTTPANDGFHEVHHGRGGRRPGGNPGGRGGGGRGGYRGGRGGGFRGRGDGSRGRGRGRGGRGD